MQERIKLSSPSHGLGDILLLTGVCKNLIAKNEKPIVALSNKVKRFEILFDGLADVVIEETSNHTQDIGCGHYTTRKLRNFFQNAESLDNRPLVLHSNESSEKWVDEYLQDKKSPIIYVPHCAKHWHEVRSLKQPVIEKLLEKFLNSGCTPILCQSEDNQVNVSYKNTLTNLDLSKYICLLRRIGVYFGCNTGDMHLAVSVGSICNVFQPKNNPFFNESEWNYQHPSITYHNLYYNL